MCLFGTMDDLCAPIRYDAGPCQITGKNGRHSIIFDLPLWLRELEI